MKNAKTLLAGFILLELKVFLKEARKNGMDCAMTELKLEEAKDALHIADNKQKKELKIIIAELEQMHRVCCLPCEIEENDDSNCGV